MCFSSLSNDIKPKKVVFLFDVGIKMFWPRLGDDFRIHELTIKTISLSDYSDYKIKTNEKKQPLCFNFGNLLTPTIYVLSQLFPDVFLFGLSVQLPTTKPTNLTILTDLLRSLHLRRICLISVTWWLLPVLPWPSRESHYRKRFNVGRDGFWIWRKCLRVKKQR